MRVKVRKKPAPAVVSGKRTNDPANVPFLTQDICRYSNNRKKKPVKN